MPVIQIEVLGIYLFFTYILFRNNNPRDGDFTDEVANTQMEED